VNTFKVKDHLSIATLRRRAKLGCVGKLAVVLFLAIVFIILIGPWPVYRDSHYQDAPYFKAALAKIDQCLNRSQLTDKPGPLKAGWAKRVITPPVGTPMAGYSDRPNGKRSTGVRDDLFVNAVVLNNGQHMVVLVTADILMTTPNVAEMVWHEVCGKLPLDENDILFTSTHTHNGPGGLEPGLLPQFSFGKYDPKIPKMIADAMVQAIIEAYKKMAPARIAHSKVDAPQFICNRVHNGATDSLLRFFIIEKETGERCYAVRYSAHPTTFKKADREISAEYPGEICRYIEAKRDAQAIFVGGAVGAMDPRAPKGPDRSTRVKRMGEALAKLILDHDGDLDFLTNVALVSVGASFGMPPLQIRPLKGSDSFSGSLRLSPLLAKIVGFPLQGRIQAIRVGDMIFMGLPYDVSGEIAKAWSEEASKDGCDLWISSHCVPYCGYLSPDAYYWVKPEKGYYHYNMYYEFRLMNWFGPNQEAMFHDLKDHILQGMAPKKH